MPCVKAPTPKAMTEIGLAEVLFLFPGRRPFISFKGGQANSRRAHRQLLAQWNELLSRGALDAARRIDRRRRPRSSLAPGNSVLNYGMEQAFWFATGIENSSPTIHHGQTRIDEMESCGH